MARILPSIRTLLVLVCSFVIAIPAMDFGSQANAGAKRKGAHSLHGTMRKYRSVSHRKRAYRSHRSGYRKAYRHGRKYYGGKRYGSKRRHYANRSYHRVGPRSYIRHVGKGSSKRAHKRFRSRPNHYAARSGVVYGKHGGYHGYKPRHLVRHYGKYGKKSRHKHYRGPYAGKRYKNHRAHQRAAAYYDKKYRQGGKNRHHRYYRGRSLVISVTPPSDDGYYNGFQPCPENANCSYRLSDNGVGPAIIKLGDPGLESSPKIITFEGNIQ